MRYIISGKNIDVTGALQNRVKDKLSKLDKFLADDLEAQVTLSVEKIRHIIEVTIPIKGSILRAEVEDTDMYAAIDKVVDVLERQLLKHKDKLRSKYRHDDAFQEAFVSGRIFPEEEKKEAESAIKIQRTKRFDMKPMYAEEACMSMDLLGHNFFMFRNAETDEISVVYKRKNGTYGLIEPEF
ncbi:MAG: ribosome-associated translation inhibitor RaiA [Epulopiscium sp.]|nr:ribosome-associated translation inhibitor RaiA [Candidatus Epulonipiscium sp.]